MQYYGGMGMDMDYSYMQEYPGSPVAELTAEQVGMDSEQYQNYLEQYREYMAQFGEGQQPDSAFFQPMQEMASGQMLDESGGMMGQEEQQQYWQQYANAMNQNYLDTAVDYTGEPGAYQQQDLYQHSSAGDWKPLQDEGQPPRKKKKQKKEKMPQE